MPGASKKRDKKSKALERERQKLANSADAPSTSAAASGRRIINNERNDAAEPKAAEPDLTLRSVAAREDIARAGHAPSVRDNRKNDAPKALRALDDMETGRALPDRYVVRHNIVDESKEFKVLTNHFAISFPDDSPTEIYCYEVDGMPESARRPKRRVLMESFIHHCKLLSTQRDAIATDYQKKIFACKDLTLADSETYGQGKVDDNIAGVTINERDFNGNPKPIELVLKYVKVLEYKAIRTYTRTENAAWEDDGLIEALAVVHTKAIQTSNGSNIFHVSGNKFFVKSDHFDLADKKVGLVGIKGFFYVPHPGTGALFLQFDTATSTFFKPMSVSEYLGGVQHRTLKKNSKAKDLIGVRVWITFDRAQASSAASVDSASVMDEPHRRMKTITGFSDKPASSETINANKSVFQHMQERYARGNRNAICVNVGGNGKGEERWYMADDLLILPYQPFRGTLTPEVTSDLIKKAARPVDDNLRAIASAKVGMFDEAVLSAFGLALRPEVTAVPARRINAPPVIFAGGSRAMTVTAKEGTWNLDDKVKFLSTSKTFKKKPCFLIPADQQPHFFSNMDQYLSCIFSNLGTNGVKGLPTQINNFPRQDTYRFSNGGFEEFKKLLGTVGATYDLAVLILPSKNREHLATYAAFKSAAEQVSGINTLCLNHSKKKGYTDGNGMFKTGSISGYAKNIGMKLNLRLGNKNHTSFDLSPTSRTHPFPKGMDMSRIMVLGADVVHPSKGSLKGTPSIAALVGTVDPELAQYLGSARRQPGLEEIIPRTNMVAMAEERLRAYHYLTKGKLPLSIVYFRDGVGNSQYSKVRDIETKAIHDAYEIIAKEKGLKATVKVTTIVVTKRHNVRLYPEKEWKSLAEPNHSVKGGNCVPGTVVDSFITSPYYFDFYLMSHKGLSGTARPAHYFVVKDEIGFSNEQLKQLANDICYSYGRSTTSVSYATPAYYADHLCERVKQYLRPLFDGDESLYSRTPGMNGFDLAAEKTYIEDKVAPYYWTRGQSDWADELKRPDGNPWHPNLDYTTFWL